MGINTARFLMLGCLGMAMFHAHAEDFRVGFINTDRIFREANTAKVAQTKLEQEFSKREKELVDLGNVLKSNSEKLERDAPTLSETQRSTRQRQLSEQDRDFQRKRREFQEDFNRRRNEEFATIVEKANAAIKRIAEQENYDVILQDAVTVNPRIDITDKVIQALGK
jgi:outer membrane protein